MENAVKKRGVSFVWHFTRIENLESILQEGLVPRAYLEAKQANIVFNDQYRLDGHSDANCLSLGHPNYKMFYSLRKANADQKWVVVAVKSEILWLKDCAFCYENAASASVTAIPLVERKGLNAFEKLFAPAVGKPDRAALKLSDNCPTNPQAEVLVFGIIEPQYIVGAAVPNKETEYELKAKHPKFQFRHLRSVYSARSDYEHW